MINALFAVAFRLFRTEKIAVVLICLVLLDFGPVYPEGKAHFSQLNFKCVREYGEGNNEYEPGRNLYPEYFLLGLPDSFLIRRIPALSLTYDDIESIEIRKDKYSSPRFLPITVTIKLEPKGIEKMETFSAKHLNERVALEIDGKIISITTIIERIKKRFNVGFTNYSLSDIETIFKKVTDKVSIVQTD